MDLGIASHQARAYSVATPLYEGPLDLLLQLIERAELDITRLALAQVTEQYLQHLKQMQEAAAEEVSAFLVIAAKLIQIKSEALLPRPVMREEGEEDPAETLAQQLILYRKFKRSAGHLAALEQAGRRTFLRLAPPPKADANLDLSGITLDDLAASARAILLEKDERLSITQVFNGYRVTIRQKIALVLTTLRSLGRSSFRMLLGAQDLRVDIVVTFLAILELIKRNVIEVNQERLFGEIEISGCGSLDDASYLETCTIELEFGE